MKFRIFLSILLMSMFLVAPCVSKAGALDRGLSLQQAGQLEEAADFFCKFAQTNPTSGGSTQEALLRCARLLDTLQDSLTEGAEKRCFWNKGAPRNSECMEREANALNSRFGPGAFTYLHAITYIPYSGIHYRTLLRDFPKSKYAPEADFYLLLKELIGHQDTVLPKIKAFLKRHPKGEWHRKGLLLWARVNEDVWYVHKKYTWILYNYKVSPEESIIRAEPYRQEALRTYQKLMKDKNTFEGRAAAREYPLLNDNRFDNMTYSILNDSSSGTLETWGIEVPRVTRSPTTPSSSVPPSLPSAGSIEQPEIMPTRAPQRWD